MIDLPALTVITCITILSIILLFLIVWSIPSMKEYITQKFTSVTIINIPGIRKPNDYILVKKFGVKCYIACRSKVHTWKEFKSRNLDAHPYGFKHADELLKEYERLIMAYKPPKKPKLKLKQKDISVYKMEQLIDGD